MKQFFLFLWIITMVFVAGAQPLREERAKDIKKFSVQIDKFEPAYLNHNTRVIKRGIRNLTKIMDREIERTTEELAKARHAMVGITPVVSEKVHVSTMSNRLTIMKYIRQRVTDFDLLTLYEYSPRELSGFRAGLNHFKKLMQYNNDPSLAIHHISPNAKRVYTPIKK